jgi:hypothetical protein
LFRIGERFIDSFAEFLHQVFQLLIHVTPDRRLSQPANLNFNSLDAKSRRTVLLTATGLRHCSARHC